MVYSMVYSMIYSMGLMGHRGGGGGGGGGGFWCVQLILLKICTLTVYLFLWLSPSIHTLIETYIHYIHPSIDASGSFYLLFDEAESSGPCSDSVAPSQQRTGNDGTREEERNMRWCVVMVLCHMMCSRYYYRVVL
jgi:hypothetical protein